MPQLTNKKKVLNSRIWTFKAEDGFEPPESLCCLPPCPDHLAQLSLACPPTIDCPPTSVDTRISSSRVLYGPSHSRQCAKGG